MADEIDFSAEIIDISLFILRFSIEDDRAAAVETHRFTKGDMEVES
jgi:hypothetical protein